MAPVAASLAPVEERAGAHCLDCNYSLRGLPISSRCPECGRSFDLRDPWTVWRPKRPNRLVKWLLRPPVRVIRLLPPAAIVCLLWGTRVPGYSSDALRLGIILLVGSFVGIRAWHAAVQLVRRRGYPDGQPDDRVQQWRREVDLAALAFVVVLLARPTLYGGFWLSKPWMDRQAQAALAEPFSQPAPWIGASRGVYYVTRARRCPHGVKLLLEDSSRYRGGWDGGPGFFFRTEPGECYRFNIGQALGGGWHVVHE